MVCKTSWSISPGLQEAVKVLTFLRVLGGSLLKGRMHGVRKSNRFVSADLDADAGALLS